MISRHCLYFIGAVLSGIMLGVSFPSFNISTLIFISLVPLLFVIQAVSLKYVILYSWLSGLIFFSISLSWLYNITNTINGVLFVSGTILGFVILVSYCALYFIPFGVIALYGIRSWAGSSILKNIQLMFVLSMSWCGLEYFRSILFTGFSWNALGVSQYANPAIIQIADKGGVAAVSALIVWMNVGVFITLYQYKTRERINSYRPHIEFLLGILPLAFAIMYGMNKLYNPPKYSEEVQIALVQPNISQLNKRNMSHDSIRKKLEKLSTIVLQSDNVDLLVWPETALPDYPRFSQSSLDLINNITITKTPLLTGAMDYRNTEKGLYYYNSSILFLNKSDIEKVYDKQHLVPFGEYVPYPDLFRSITPLDSDFSAGSSSDVFLVKKVPPFSVLICFEDTISRLASNSIKKGAKWIINQTNDAWFDPSSQSEQHLAHAVFRCVENGVPMARCCNTGVTCIIDIFGRIKQRINIRSEGFLIGTVDIHADNTELTFYTRYGDLFSKIGVLILTLSIVFISLNHYKRTSSN